MSIHVHSLTHFALSTNCVPFGPFGITATTGDLGGP